MQLAQKEKDLQNKELLMDIELLQREMEELQLGDPSSAEQSCKNKEAMDICVKQIEEKMKILGFGFNLQDLQELQMECQTCREEFVKYQNEPNWANIPETRFDVAEKKRQQKEWKENVRSKFYTRLDCSYGCSGVCLACAELWWDKKGSDRPKGVKTRKCPYCRSPWKTKPEPFVVYFRS
eukprot:TRINITY_DN51790_c0_g1_i1.p3 TRINITY_DN51790_c0_g1~~TRINITY_DN51790_c0_g1_i1.p3  ORF type:complete len:206 (-),score=32.77 TRINITY_DN51790_c0_g1_i1:59-598(-)